MSSENDRSLREEIEESRQEIMDRQRDEAGRFASTKPDEPNVETPAEATPDTPVEAPNEKGGKVPKTAEATPAEDPFPPSWKKEQQAHWNKLPPEVRKYINQHEAETRKALTSQDQDRLGGKVIREVAAPYMPMLQAEGLNLVQAVQGLLQQNYVLRMGTPEQKRAMLLSAAKTFNVDLTEPVQQQGWVDPQVHALQQELAELKGWRDQSVQAQKYQEQVSIDSQLSSFASAPGHEHMRKVAPVMASLLHNNQANDLEDAYQKAIWADPELRSTLLTQQQVEAEAKRAAEAKAKTSAARNASGSVRGSSSGLSTAASPAPKGSLREELKAAFAASKDR